MANSSRIVLARGDGIGPEIVGAVLKIFAAAKVPVEYDEIEVGEAVYKRGISSGIAPEAWKVLRQNRVMLKGPITTPQGGGYKSLNVTMRKGLSLFANVRRAKAYSPFVRSFHPGLDMVIIRENEEGLYAGIEYRQTAEVYQALKLVTRAGCESIVRYAFEYARAYGRKKVTCMSKDNILKHTDGLFHAVFDQVATEYTDIENDHQIIDIGAARVAAQPEQLDVVVTLNLYGDIISDIAAQVAGSVGLAGSANIGHKYAMFEAIHGSAPDIAGKGIANPSGILNAATMMLVHLGHAEHAELINNAWLKTLEDGIHTGEIYREGVSKQRVGTDAFASAVIDRIGQEPVELKAVRYQSTPLKFSISKPPVPGKALVGVDVFLDYVGDVDDLSARVRLLSDGILDLKLIASRGVEVFPERLPESLSSDHWCCRFAASSPISSKSVVGLLGRFCDAGLDVIKTENLYDFDGKRSYSMAQGE